MSWLLAVCRSSIGKKCIMALSGICLSLFLFAHLAGNALSFRGKEVYDSYAAHLHALGLPRHVLEALLALVFLAHILTAITLFYENLTARPHRYAMPGDDRRFSAAAMPYTGIIILIFLLLHLFNFHLAAGPAGSAQLLRTTLSQPFIALFYLFALGALTLHLSHGFRSLFQSLGLNHPKYNNLVQISALSLALITGIFFMLIPLLFLTSDHFLL